MIKQPSLHRVLPDASRGTTARWSGAANAPATRPARSATTAAAARGRALGGQAAPGLERRPRARHRGGPPTCFARLDRPRPGPHDGQQGPRPPRARAMPRPGRPALHGRQLQAHVALGRLDAALHRPAAPRHPPHRLPRGGGRGTPPVGGQVGGLPETPPDQPPAAPGGVHGRGADDPAPSSPRGPFAPSPAWSRVHPSTGQLARRVCPWRGGAPRPP